MNAVSSEKSSTVDEDSDWSPTKVSELEILQSINASSPKRKRDIGELPEYPIYCVDSPIAEERSLPQIDAPIYLHHRAVKDMYLPTLEETASVSSSSDVSDTKNDEDRRSGTSEDEQLRQRLLQDDLKDGAPYRGMTASQKEFFKLKLLATKQASLGKEDEAIAVYHRVLRLMKADLSRIKRSLQKSQHKLPQLRGGAQRLHEEWTQLATTLAEIRTVMAILYERMGEFDKAISSCEVAKEAYESYSRLGIADSDIDQYASQMDAMLDRLAAGRASFDERKKLHESILQCRVKLAQTRDMQSKELIYNEAFELLEIVLNMERVSLGETHPQLSDTLRIFATLYFEKGQVEHALETTEDAVAIMKLCLGPQHPRTALAVRSLAKIHEMSNRGPEDIDLAILYYNEAIAAFQIAYGQNHIMVGSTLNNVAVLHIQRGEFHEAVEKLSDALESYESVTDSGGVINPDTTQVWKNLGECYTRQKEWENAHFAYTSALEVQREIRLGVDSEKDSGSSSPSSTGNAIKHVPKGSDDVSLADTMIRLGRATKETGRYDDSYQIYKEGLRIFRKLYVEAKKFHNGEHLASSQDKLAHTMYCIAEVQEIRGKYDEAVQLYTESLNLRLNSDANRSNRMNMVHCAMALVGIGSVHMRKRESGDACVVFNESLGFLRAHGTFMTCGITCLCVRANICVFPGVPETHEIVVAIQGRLLAAESSLISNSFDSECSFDSPKDSTMDRTLQMDIDAEIQIELGDYDSAINVLTSILAIRRRRLTRKQRKLDRTTNLREKSEVARTLGNFATVLRLRGESRQSLMLYTEARRLLLSNGIDDDDELLVRLNREINQWREGELADL